MSQITDNTCVVRYIRITGTRNTASKHFHLISFECMFLEKPLTVINGFICPDRNVATVDQGATVVEGVSRDRNALISQHPNKYRWKWGYTCHQLGNGAIVVQLSQPYLISSIRFLLYDLDSRHYSYTVEVFDGLTDWVMVADRSTEPCRSWQVITFPRQLVSFIRVIGKHNSADDVFHMIHLECPYPVSDQNLSFESTINRSVIKTPRIVGAALSDVDVQVSSRHLNASRTLMANVSNNAHGSDNNQPHLANSYNHANTISGTVFAL
ncbi:BTB/POZ domain-containing protein 9 [Cichlidogyrus casuarinus]|uniref:BTB/POZ domain-containing protein 9 n=1 Tax=Cichlidogyrus casuarinus TaxID=1844966 RepID=A0ABD2PNY1_9PLAT